MLNRNTGKELFRKDRDVAWALAQWRHRQRDHLQLVIEFAVEAAVCDCPGEVVMAGGDDTDIHPERLHTASCDDLATVEEMQQGGLGRRPQRADIVEEQCAARRGVQIPWRDPVASAGAEAL